MPFDPPRLPQQVTIPSDLRAAREVEEQILNEAGSLGYSDECNFAIRLALEEAIVNAHRHGNGGDSTKKIHISYQVDEKRVVVRVRDEGAGFNPDDIPDPTSPDRISLPNGRGLMLMNCYVDEVSFSEQGNEVQLIKEKA